jgi:TIR domain
VDELRLFLLVPPARLDGKIAANVEVRVPIELPKLRVFISWSGSQAEIVARAFHEFLPDVVSAIQPFFSGSAIDKGIRWHDVLADTLQGSSCAIVCLTRDSLTSPWVAFETGAVSRAAGPDDAKTRIWTYLLDVTRGDFMLSPFAEYQPTKPTKEDTFALICSVNKLSPDSASPESLKRRFEGFWRSFEPQLQEALKLPRGSVVQAPDANAMISEILLTVRSIQHSIFIHGVDTKGTPLLKTIHFMISSVLRKRGASVPVFQVLPSDTPDYFRIVTDGKDFLFAVDSLIEPDELSAVVELAFGPPIPPS